MKMGKITVFHCYQQPNMGIFQVFGHVADANNTSCTLCVEKHTQTDWSEVIYGLRGSGGCENRIFKN